MGSTTPTYSVYGLHVHTGLDFPELGATPPGDGPCPESESVTIRYGSVPPLASKTESSGSSFFASADRVLLDCPEVGRFDVSGGTEIVVEPAPESEPVTVRNYVLGIGLALLLHQRGQLVLHAGGVSIEGRAALFVGQKGAGKSTLTAALNVRGHSFITDDIAPIEVGASGQITVHAGVGGQRLWPDAVRHLGRRPEDLPRLHSTVDKRLAHVEGRKMQGPLPVQALYVLEYGSDLRVTPLFGMRAFREVVLHSFLPAPMIHKMGAERHFGLCEALLRAVPVFRIRRPEGLSHLDRTVEAIEAHLRHPQSTTA